MTPSPQRAAALRLAYDLAQIGRRDAWRTADAIGYRSWLEREAARVAETGASGARPLAAVEEWLLWREAVEAEDGATAGAALLADSMARAARLLAEWSIPPRVLEASASDESVRLARALAHIDSRAREARAAPSHALPGLLRGSIGHGRVVFAGFTEASTSRRAWMSAALERGAAVSDHVAEHAPGRRRAVLARDPAHELELAAQWCRAHLAQDPSRRLLIVVPDLPQRRAEALRVLEQTLAPRQALGDAREEGVLNVEGGEPLAGYPVVRHALTGLKLLTAPQELAAWSAWLRSAFWSVPAAQRACLDAWLRRVHPHEGDARDLLASLEAAPAALAEAAGSLRAALARALEALGGPAATAEVGLWAQRFEQALAALGWPGARTVSSLEQQARARFEDVLFSLLSLGGWRRTLSAPQAVRLLAALLERTAFAPASGEAAVTLSGSLADPVLRYDGIWVTGLHADAWPPPPAVNPFIPVSAQRQAGLPGVTVEGSLAAARALLGCWSRSAAELVMSSPGDIEDRGCLPSPLIREPPGVEEWVPGERLQTLAELVRRSRRAERFADERGSAWRGHAPLPAGTRALGLQSRCPFRAYGELRLAAVPLETPRPGIDPRYRGRLLHRALELMWRTLGGTEGLEQRVQAGGLERLIEECVGRAAVETRLPRPAGPRSAEAAMERRELRRTAGLLAAVAALERERPPFRVSALERPLDFALGGARLAVRIDRIDELDDGTLAILDYKTGKLQSLDWLADRIGDPQLIVYLLATGGTASTLAEVRLSAGAVAFRGLADRSGRLAKVGALAPDPGTAASAWREQIERWQASIERLARDFLGGIAAVDPIPGTCRACHLHTLCRVSEVRPQSEPPNGDDAPPST